MGMSFFLISHFTVLIHDAVDATLAHGLTVVDVLRRERTVTPPKDLDQQQRHSDSKQNHTYQQRL